MSLRLQSFLAALSRLIMIHLCHRRIMGRTPIANLGQREDEVQTVAPRSLYHASQTEFTQAKFASFSGKHPWETLNIISNLVLKVFSIIEMFHLINTNATLFLNIGKHYYCTKMYKITTYHCRFLMRI